MSIEISQIYGGRRPLGKSRHRFDDVIKIYFKQIDCELVGRTD
jgi:hypothetical protein